jgi:transcriptional regulator with XRE-family HTH domain
VDEVANAIAGQGGAHLSANYIWMLRKGQRDNPTVRAVESLARFFGVPTAYFFDSDVEVRANYQLQVAAQVIEIAMEAMAKIIDVAGRSEPPSGAGPGQEP